MNRSILPAIVILSVPLLAQADNQRGQLLINPAISYQYFDSEINLNEATGFGVGLEYRFGSNWAAEIAIFESETEHNYYDGWDVDLLQYKLDGLYYLAQGGTVQPYLGFGVGHAEFNEDTGRYDDETQANAGGGLRFNFGDSWSARWDLRAVYSVDENQAGAMTTLGISYAFGGSTAEPEPQKTVADSDRDGVADSWDQCPGTSSGLTVDSEGCALDLDNDGVPDGRDICEGTLEGAQVDVTGCPKDGDGDGIYDGIDQCPNTSIGARVDQTGCVGVTETVTVESLTLRIEFASGSAQIVEEHQDELQKVANFMREYSDVEVSIEGHSDSQGGWAFNKTLSQRRADSVKNALVKDYGIDIDRITAVGYGEEKPIASNETPEGRKKNRRVVAVIQKEVRK